MSSDQNNHKKRIAELEQELRQKDAEIAKYRTELARANHELEKIIGDIGQELKMAAQIQKLLSPTELPNISGFEFSSKFLPGTERGGDYFDIFEHEDKMKFGVILASSSGYSMSALFLGVLIKISAQIEAKRGLKPDQVIQKMAQELVPQVENQDTASIFYGVFDRRTYEMCYCSVGVTTGYLFPFGSETLTKFEPSTGPFAKNYSEKPLAQTIQLNPRDRLLLCTEGVLSAKNKKEEVFGQERLSQAALRTARMGVHDLRNEVMLQVEQFTGLHEPVRDQTVIVIEVKDKVIKLAKQFST